MTTARFDGQVAVITGAGRGLGREYALLLARLGATVVVNDCDTAPAQQVVSEILAAGGQALAATESVADPNGARAIVAAAAERYGRLDVVIHNAGIVRRAPLSQMTVEDFDAVLDVHLRGAFLLVRQAFPLMCQAGYGRVVLTSSIGGLYGNHTVAGYAAAKAGVIGLSHVVALEGAEHGVRCNVIVPAAVTRMAEGLDTSAYPPMGADLVAPVVGWLAHESCSVTGEVLTAIAGRVARIATVESAGVYQPAWTVDDVGAHIGAICDITDPVVFPVVPDGHNAHLSHSFAMARGQA
ncbi:SDR family NAD(P)-dependent oxidoreductase [Mycobacterium sp. shizuoka-1]|uniref:SDR family NAD(P)-dependent oxidoreductase n=1 Tax=Mycobacterium sp. shizuoka-1 TaxID=2039281 RepID=UPI000C066763|nr:SDR family NAD(P)-dependent oxidoreductase [Mycobacterium sp. shizuoka-1]GAY13332.1 short-chain dehydrogenase [Mycobacterium sp. shizuoka-1]